MSALAVRYGPLDARLSASAVRRHLRTHVPPPREACTGSEAGLGREHQPITGNDAPFTDGRLDPERLLVTTIRKTLNDLGTVEAEVENARAAGNVADVTRAITVALRTKHLLVRELKAYAGSAGSTEAPDLDSVPTVFDQLIDQPINDRLLLEVTTRALLQKLRAVEAGYLAAAKRSPELAERTLSIFLKTQTALEGALQRLRNLRQDGNGHTTLGSAPAGAGSHVEPLPTAFDGLLEGQLSPHAVSQAVVLAIAQKLKCMEQEYQTARLAGRGDADQALTKFLKVLPLLQRALERFKDTGKPQEEAQKTLRAAQRELTVVAFAAVDKFVRAHSETLHKLVTRYSKGELIQKLLAQYMDDFSTKWRQALGLQLYQDLSDAYQQSELWRRLRNYPQQPLGDEPNAKSGSQGQSNANDVTKEVSPEESRGCPTVGTASLQARDDGERPNVTKPIVSEREEAKAKNAPLPVASGPDARSYAAAALVNAMRCGEIRPIDALNALQQGAASYTMDDLSHIMIEARSFPEVKKEAMRLLAERDEQKRPV